MIAYNRSFLLEQSGVGKIIQEYGVSKKVASYLILVYPCENEHNKWNEYESAKEYLSNACFSSGEYEQAIKCLTDMMEI